MRLAATLLVFRVAECVSATVESPAVVDTRLNDQRMYMWPCLCSRRLVVSPVASNSSHWLTVASLLLAGDVQPNPGPAPQWKYPCGICSRAVHSDQKGISASDEGWCCSRCHRTAFPFHDSSINDSLWVPSNCSRNVSGPITSLTSSNWCSIYYSNCCSLAPKLDHLQAIASSVVPTVIAACETWLDETVPDSSLFIPNYHIIR